MTSTGGAPDITFRGTDGNECEEFIAAVEELAFTEGWSRDREGMLLFARSRLRHKALRWFARLDPSKKNDWDLFVEALFDQYPLDESPAQAEIATPIWSATTFSPSVSTAVLPSADGPGTEAIWTANETRPSVLPSVRAYDPSAPGSKIGVLRIVAENGMTCPQYIWRGRFQIPLFRTGDSYPIKHDRLGTTIDRQQALTVCFISSPETHTIGCLNAASDLADLSLFYGPLNFATYELRVANGVTVIYKEGHASGENVSRVWSVLSDGSLQASLSAYDPKSADYYTGKYTAEDFKTTEVHLDVSGTSVCFVKPGTPLWQDDPQRSKNPGRYEIKARVVFEPL